MRFPHISLVRAVPGAHAITHRGLNPIFCQRELQFLPIEIPCISLVALPPDPHTIRHRRLRSTCCQRDLRFLPLRFLYVSLVALSPDAYTIRHKRLRSTCYQRELQLLLLEIVMSPRCITASHWQAQLHLLILSTTEIGNRQVAAERVNFSRGNFTVSPWCH